jgi:AraC-like DNA-binding protein
MSTHRDGEAVRTSCFTDADEAAASYHGVDMELSVLSRATSDWRMLQVDTGSALFISTELAAAVSAACVIKRDTMSFAMGFGELDRWTVNGHAIDSRSIAFFSEGAQTLTRTAAPLNWLSLHFTAASFTRSYESFTGQAMPAPQGIRIFAPAEAQNRALRHQFMNAAQLARTVPHLLREREIRTNLEKSLLESLFQAVEVPVVSESVNHRSLATRARDYLRAHTSRAVFQSDLCAELGIADRSLRRLFIEYFGMSPARYLKLLRLNHAHRALRQADESPASVTEIGMRYGFFDLGRFAADYRALFGELPSSTLRRTRQRIA